MMERLISVLSNGEIRVGGQSSSAVYYRAPHDIERYNVNVDDYRYISNNTIKGPVRDVVTITNTSLPEVYRLKPFHSVGLNATLQWLWKNINPEIGGEKWSTLLDWKLAWCNSSGFGQPDKPRANYVLGKNIGNDDPYFDFSRYCGGAIFKGIIDDSLLRIDAISAFNPPSAETVLNNPHLWYWGTSVSPRGYVYYIRRMGLDGTMKKVRIPLIVEKPVNIPLNELHKLPDGFLPEATWVHYP
jgi:hypothetical protein